ncbi:uncharacterized protein isoform X2 [Rhodnius prolixus]|uniref:uncharacterized protein isoform X2 n=1 Tax=Rhodnius prolixus TaxID=13249 RepID=UPI000356512D
MSSYIYKLTLQVAWSYAEKGLLVFILSKSIIEADSAIHFNSNTSRPEILQRIIFRYFSESSEVLQWCHEVHNRTKIPRLFLMSALESFGLSHEFEAVEICAALLDAIQFCSQCSQKCTYLLVSICTDKGDTYPSNLAPLFDRVWHLESSQCNKHTFFQMSPSVHGVPLKKLNILCTS